MIYDFLTYIIIAIASLALIWKILQFFTIIKKKGKQTSCSGCAGNCEVKTLKFPKKELLKSYDQYRLHL